MEKGRPRLLKVKNYNDIVIGQGLCSLFGTRLKVHLYLVDGLLIDTGPYRLRKDSIPFLKEHMIEQVVLTHVHEDHSGMAYWLQKHKKVPIYLHPQAIKDAEDKGRYRLYRRLMWGKRKPFNPCPIPSIIKTKKYKFEAIEAPGHVAFHHVFYEKSQGWLFTGDLFISEKVVIAYDEENMQDIINTLEKLLKLDFDTVFCAHAGVVRNGKEKVKKKLLFLLGLQERVNEYRGRGFSDKEIDKILYPQTALISIVSRGEGSTYNIVHTI